MTIFIIDDEKPLLSAAKRIIETASPGADVATFSDSAQALAAVTEQKRAPDIVFSDIEMPGISGLELAMKIKAASPRTRIVFLTGYSQYAVAAFKTRAQGYLMKPLTLEAAREEILFEPPLPEPDKNMIAVRCFGYFEVFWKGEPLLFKRKQTKELFAFLIDRRGALCSAEEIALALWEDEFELSAAKQRIRNLIHDLKTTLQKIGMEGALVRSRGKLAVRLDMVDCDYYHMLNGEAAFLNRFSGDYMLDYSWAEPTAGKLFFSAG